jgi:hypothetical protein
MASANFAGGSNFADEEEEAPGSGDAKNCHFM